MAQHENTQHEEHSKKEKVVETVRKSKLTVKRFREPQNKSALKHAANILKHDVIGFFAEVSNILHQTEGIQAYSNCKTNPTCSDAIEEYRVHIPPMYDEVLTDKPLKPTPGAATVDALASMARATGDILSDVGSMETYAHRHASYPLDPTKFDPNRPKSQLLRDREAVIRNQVEIIESPDEDQK